MRQTSCALNLLVARLGRNEFFRGSRLIKSSQSVKESAKGSGSVQNADEFDAGWRWLVKENVISDWITSQIGGEFFTRPAKERCIRKQVESFVKPFKKSVCGSKIVAGDIGPDIHGVALGLRRSNNVAHHQLLLGRQS